MLEHNNLPLAANKNDKQHVVSLRIQKMGGQKQTFIKLSKDLISYEHGITSFLWMP